MCSLLPTSPAGACNHANLLTALHWLSIWPYTVAISFFPGSKDRQLAQQLLEENYQYHFHTSAEGTKASYHTHRTSYLWFCEHIGYPPLPAQSSSFCQYAAFLAHSLKATSIPSYLNIIGILHKEFNLPNPLLGNWPLQSLLTDCLGLSRSKVCPPPGPKTSIFSILGHIHLHLHMRSSFDASVQAICLVIIGICFLRAISLLNLHVPLMPPSNSYVWILLSLVVKSLYVGVKLSNSMSGWFFFPCHLYQTPRIALLRQLKGLSLGWFFFPCHLYQTPPFALLRQFKWLSLGWFFFPCDLYQTPPLCPVMAVKRVIPGVVLFPLPFISDSPQFALLQQLKGLSAFYLSGIAWLPGFRLSSLSWFNPFNYPMFLKKVKCHSLCHSAFGQRSCLPLLP